MIYVNVQVKIFVLNQKTGNTCNFRVHIKMALLDISAMCDGALYQLGLRFRNAVPGIKVTFYMYIVIRSLSNISEMLSHENLIIQDCLSAGIMTCLMSSPTL